MFKTIFFHEIRFWLRNPLPYLFFTFLFLTTFLSMWGMAAEEPSGPTTVVQNSASRLIYLANFVSQIMIFMVPAISGISIYRDFHSRIHTVIFTYPFSKNEYLFAKFLSSFLVVFILSASIGFGFGLGSLMPGVNPDAIAPFSIKSYLTLYGIFLLPNLLFLSTLVFATVALSRNVYVGFIAAILVFILNGMLSSLPGDLGALFDPLAKTTVESITRFWTLDERNHRVLPLANLLIMNRIFWLGISISVGAFFVHKFQLNQQAPSFFNKSFSPEPSLFNTKVRFFKIPEVRYDFSLTSRLQAIWRTSNMDLRAIIMSWPFVSILISGFLMVYFQQVRMAPQYGVPILPTTAEMLRIPMFIFSGIFNLLTFLYSGVLIFKGVNTRMQSLIDISPQPEWFFLVSRFVTVIKMQFVLLTLILFSGIVVQTIKGYFHYELLHYAFELYIINFLHFAIWATVALFIHSLLPNLYISFFVLILIPIGFLMLPAAAETLDLPWLAESFLQFNHIPDLYVGFEYSAFNHYGSALAVYFFYKAYWALGAVLLVFLSQIVWRRGISFGFKEKLQIVRNRFKGGLRLAILVSLFLFVLMGANVFYQEHYVSKTFYTQEDEDWVYAQNEIRYGHFLDQPQPRLVSANLDMDIFPLQRDYQLRGRLKYLNVFDKPIDTILVACSFKDDVNIEMVSPSKLLKHDQELHYYTYVLDKSMLKGDSLIMKVNIKNFPNTYLHNNSRVLSNGTFITGQIIPKLGVRQAFLTSKQKRQKYGLGERSIRDILPSDSTLLGYEFSSNNMGNIQYETRITTSKDQMAFSMGELLESKQENGRNFFHYKSKGLIKNTISWISGSYEKSEGDLLDIYHHPDHDQNNEYIIQGAEMSLAYCEKWFSPLQHDKLKLIEFPITIGTYATLNGNMIPFSESKMLCDIDHEKNEEYNHPFFVAAHEVAHYWWGHKVDPANVKGGRLISESMAEYISKRVVELSFGKDVIRKDRENQQNTYFTLRAEGNDEVPLNVAGLDQQYLGYVKGGLALTTLSEYMGETPFNLALASFEKAYAYKEPPFATSLNFIDTLKNHVPDSLLYLVHDLFETITLYDNKINAVEFDQGITTIDFNIRKFRSDQIGRNSADLPLADYIRIATYQADSNLEDIHLIKVEKSNTRIGLNLGYEPIMVRLDPDVLLLDSNRENNIWRK